MAPLRRAARYTPARISVVTLYAAVEADGRWYTDARVGRNARPLADAPHATLRWKSSSRRPANYSNEDATGFHFTQIDYQATAIDATDATRSPPTSARRSRPTTATASARCATSSSVTQGDRTLASPGAEARRGRGSGGLTDAVMRVSIRRDDTYLGYLTEMYGQPYIWASAGTSDAVPPERAPRGQRLRRLRRLRRAPHGQADLVHVDRRAARGHEAARAPARAATTASIATTHGTPLPFTQRRRPRPVPAPRRRARRGPRHERRARRSGPHDAHAVRLAEGTADRRQRLRRQARRAAPLGRTSYDTSSSGRSRYATRSRAAAGTRRAEGRQHLAELVGVDRSGRASAAASGSPGRGALVDGVERGELVDRRLGARAGAQQEQVLDDDRVVLLQRAVDRHALVDRADVGRQRELPRVGIAGEHDDERRAGARPCRRARRAASVASWAAPASFSTMKYACAARQRVAREAGAAHDAMARGGDERRILEVDQARTGRSCRSSTARGRRASLPGTRASPRSARGRRGRAASSARTAAAACRRARRSATRHSCAACRRRSSSRASACRRRCRGAADRPRSRRRDNRRAPARRVTRARLDRRERGVARRRIGRLVRPDHALAPRREPRRRATSSLRVHRPAAELERLVVAIHRARRVATASPFSSSRAAGRRGACPDGIPSAGRRCRGGPACPAARSRRPRRTRARAPARR